VTYGAGALHRGATSHFHDQFIVVDWKVCYHLGGSINHAGAKATVIGLKSDDIRDRVLADAEKAWAAATSVAECHRRHGGGGEYGAGSGVVGCGWMVMVTTTTPVGAGNAINLRMMPLVTRSLAHFKVTGRMIKRVIVNNYNA
jgi:hypothetical protein